jgi:hypothetical protein
MIELVSSDQQRKFGTDKRDTLPQFCLDCDVRFACHGGCPRNRFTTTPDGEEGLNYLCPSYKAFFKHVDPAMKLMSRLLKQNRAPAEIVQLGVPRTESQESHLPQHTRWKSLAIAVSVHARSEPSGTIGTGPAWCAFCPAPWRSSHDQVRCWPDRGEVCRRGPK